MCRYSDYNSVEGADVAVFCSGEPNFHVMKRHSLLPLNHFRASDTVALPHFNALSTASSIHASSEWEESEAGNSAAELIVLLLASDFACSTSAFSAGLMLFGLSHLSPCARKRSIAQREQAPNFNHLRAPQKPHEVRK